MGRKRIQCFYCGENVLPARVEQDHFPKPASCGGTKTVPACILCHDLKDRTSWEDLPADLKADFWDDFPKFKRGTKIVFAQFMRVVFESARGIELSRTLPTAETEAASRRAQASEKAGGKVAE